MIESLISSKTRVKLLLKFFLNEGTRGYLRGLESEFGESSNAIRLELNRLVAAGLLSSEAEGNKRYFQANRQHPLYDNIHEIVRKHIGLDSVVETIASQLGNLEQVFVAGSFSRGLDSGIIDLVLVGEVDRAYLIKLIDRAEDIIERKVRYVVYNRGEIAGGALAHFQPAPMLLWDQSSKLPA